MVNRDESVTHGARAELGVGFAICERLPFHPVVPSKTGTSVRQEDVSGCNVDVG